MHFCGCTCCEKEKHIIYLIGKKKHKDLFMENVLGIKPEDGSYKEVSITHDGVPLVVQICDSDIKIQELDDMHSKLACGIVYLTEEDRPIDYENFALFVLVNQKSRQVSDKRLTVASIVNNSFAECKEGFSMLVSNLKNH